MTLLFLLFCLTTDEPRLEMVVEGAYSGCVLFHPGNRADEYRTLAGLPQQVWRRAFPIYLGEEVKRGYPSLVGTYTWTTEGVYFRPRLGFLPGRTYRGIFQPHTLRPRRPDTSWTGTFGVPTRIMPAPRVTALTPSTAEWPENMLRFYVHFSRPMADNLAYRDIRLLDADDVEIPHAFVVLPEELWDRTKQRLTVLFDPGRIKQGVGPNRELGPPLVPGESYTIEIGLRPDMGGNKLLKPYRKAIIAVAADRTQPDPTAWTLKPVTANARTPLLVELDKVYDAALLDTLIAVYSDDRLVPGKVTATQQETVWRFVPDNNWRFAPHELVVSPQLEDICGNRPYRLFDAPTDTPTQKATPVHIPFHPSPAAKER